MLGIFSCAFGPSVYLLSRNVYLDIPPFFGGLFLCEQFHILISPVYFNINMFLCYKLFAEFQTLCLAHYSNELSNTHVHPKPGALIILALQVRKLRHKKVECLAQCRGEDLAVWLHSPLIPGDVSVPYFSQHFLDIYCSSLPSFPPSLLQFSPPVGDSHPQLLI